MTTITLFNYVTNEPMEVDRDEYVKEQRRYWNERSATDPMNRDEFADYLARMKKHGIDFYREIDS